MKILLILACAFFTSNIYAAAGCVTNARGQTVCGNTGSTAVVTTPNTSAVVVNPSSTAVVVNPNTSGTAARYNPNTGNAVKVEQGAAGVNHTETRYGGEAYTKNGKGVVQTPNGTTCVRTANGRGCR